MFAIDEILLMKKFFKNVTEAPATALEEEEDLSESAKKKGKKVVDEMKETPVFGFMSNKKPKILIFQIAKINPRNTRKSLKTDKQTHQQRRSFVKI